MGKVDGCRLHLSEIVKLAHLLHRLTQLSESIIQPFLQQTFVSLALHIAHLFLKDTCVPLKMGCPPLGGIDLFIRG